MGSIAVLPPTLASQIAAGEVVDRPASALKELLENALDAEATRCDIHIAGGGVQLLSVRDNGHGMARSDVLLCVERHATSKLHAFDDLCRLLSFGFRGEALPSIASVSKLTVRSRRPSDLEGTELTVVGGVVGEAKSIGMAPGTEIVVEDLFYNVPARRKFLRSSGTESGYLCEVAEQVALANPQASILLTRDGRKAREWLRVKSREERVREVLAEDALAKCYGERGPLTVEAYLGRPERAKSAANGLRLFCNARPIKDRALMHSVVQAYGSVLERGRYPRGVIYLNLPQQLVDVNVHPQKTEVRFADLRAVADALFDIVSAELHAAFSLPTGGATRFGSASNTSLVQQRELTAERDERPAPVVVSESANATRATRASSHAVRPQPSAVSGEFSTSHVVTSLDDEAHTASSLPWYGATGRPEVPTRLADRAAVDEGVAVDGRASLDERAVESGAAPESRAALEGEQSTTRAHDNTARASNDAPSNGDVASSLRPGAAAERISFEPSSGVNVSARRVTSSGAEVAWSKLRFIAQVRNLYLLCEGDEGLFVLDQHAAAERVAFDKLKRQLNERQLAGQVLLFPAVVQLGGAQMEAVEVHHERIAQLGFEVRRRGESSVSIHQVPKLLHRAEPERLFLDLVHELTRDGRSFSQSLDLVLATMACHGAVRAGDPLARQECEALLRALDEVQFAGHCPHGRPIVTFTPWSELERKVGRR